VTASVKRCTARREMSATAVPFTLVPPRYVSGYQKRKRNAVVGGISQCRYVRQRQVLTVRMLGTGEAFGI
jgi:hypothetical protein